MTATSRSRAKHAFRIATLIVPSALAWYVAFAAPHSDALARVVRLALAPLYVLVVASLVMRAAVIVLGRPRDRAAPPILERIDVLTSSGAALGWLSALAIGGAVWLGWASLAALGMLGTALFHVVALLAFVALRSGDPVGRAAIVRRFSPTVVTEGDDVIEELRVTGARIPIGYRLFVTGRVGPRWATTRNVLDASESGGEIVLESEIGPAVRGEHEAPPLEVWLEDTFGLCRSPRVHVAAARLRVLPRMNPVAKAPLLADHGIGPREPRHDASRLPTEGSFALREYQQGDDARRIHWVRSLAARELIVRLPDEIPPDRPRVRLVLDTFFPEAPALECDAPAEMLDSLVRVWLAVGRTLAEQGARVTLVTALRRGAGDAIEVVRMPLTTRAPLAVRDLGARIDWQDRLTVDDLLTDEATFVVSRGVMTNPPASGKARWIVAIPDVSEPPMPATPDARLPHPMGSPDNRGSSLRRVREERTRAWTDRARALLTLRAHVARPPPGSLAALTNPDGSVRLEAMR